MTHELAPQVPHTHVKRETPEASSTIHSDYKLPSTAAEQRAVEVRHRIEGLRIRIELAKIAAIKSHLKRWDIERADKTTRRALVEGKYQELGLRSALVDELEQQLIDMKIGTHAFYSGVFIDNY